MTKRQLEVWAKLALIAVVLLSLVIFMVQNSEKVDIRFLAWGPLTVPKFSLVLSTAGLTLLLAKIVGGVGRLVREARGLMHSKRARAEAPPEAGGSAEIPVSGPGENRETNGTTEQGEVR